VAVTVGFEFKAVNERKKIQIHALRRARFHAGRVLRALR